MDAISFYFLFETEAIFKKSFSVPCIVSVSSELFFFIFYVSYARGFAQ